MGLHLIPITTLPFCRGSERILEFRFYNSHIKEQEHKPSSNSKDVLFASTVQRREVSHSCRKK